MFRLAAPGFLGMVAFIFWIWAVFDVIATDRILVRNLDKMAWLFVVIFLPTIGALAWAMLGRPTYAGWRPGDTESRQPKRQSRYIAPEDRDDWGR